MLIFMFVLGLIMGSFYTVVGLRLPKNESIVKPGSHCPNCNHALSWYELIPVISWLFLRGKCHKCKTKISIVYPLIEILTASLFTLAYYLYGFSFEFFAMLVISSLLVIIYVSDFTYLVILDEVLIFGYVLILLLKYLYFGIETLLISILSGLIMLGFMLLVKLLGDKAFKRESLGGGDIKLAMFFGFALGIRLSFMSLVVGCFIAFPYAIFCTFSHKEREIPFGPFLMSGMLLVFLLETRIDNFINMLF